MSDGYKESQEGREGNIHISFSEFQKYMECPHRHLIEKYLAIEEQPPSIHLFFGSTIHEALEFSLKKNLGLKKRIELFKSSFKREMDEKLYDSPDYKNVNEFILQGENILKSISLKTLNKKYEIIGIEEPLYENLFGIYYFKGFIDLIVRNRKTGKYIIIDWKTSGEAWDLEKKLKDEIFVSQTRFYKYFYGRKHNIPFDKIECKYVVLNRLKNKKNPYSGFGELQNVPMSFNTKDIEVSLDKLIEVIKKIHINKTFPKAKLIGDKRNCFFCAYKQDHPLCNMSSTQDRSLLIEHGKITEN